MDVQYHRELNRTWMILPRGEKTDHFAVRMMEENRLEHLLTVRENPDGESGTFRFDITGGSSLARKLEMRTLSYRELRTLMDGLASALEELEEYLIDRDHLLLDPALIYLMPDLGHLQFCCHPSENQDFFMELKDLVQYCLNKTDHQDRKAAAAVYELFDVCSREYYRFEDLMEVIGRHGAEEMQGRVREKLRYGSTTGAEPAEEGLSYRGDMAGKQSSAAAGLRAAAAAMRAPARPVSGGRYTYRPVPLSEQELPEPQSGKNAGAERRPRRKGIRSLRVIRPLLITGVPSAGLCVLTVWRYLHAAVFDWRWPAAALCLLITGLAAAISENRQTRKDADIDPGGNPVQTNAGAPEEYLFRAGSSPPKTAAFRAGSSPPKTVAFRAGSSPPENAAFRTERTEGATEILSGGSTSRTEHSHRLQPLNSASAGEILIGAGLVMVGKPEGGADAVIDRPAVSRRHAELEEHGGCCYIRDCRSTNGTRVNGRRLTPEVWYPLEAGDIVMFADAEYRFL